VKPDLVGVHEIAQLLGVSRQRVDQIVHSDDTFPQPVAEIAAGRIWNRSEIERWLAERGRITRENRT
jgi:predicted DNA-binding transcriptional regulator AlpA